MVTVTVSPVVIVLPKESFTTTVRIVLPISVLTEDDDAVKVLEAADTVPGLNVTVAVWVNGLPFSDAVMVVLTGRV
jgi:hypothetical protein